VIAGAPVGPFELIGREGETRELRRFVEQLQDGARAALVRGEPGFGKTMIWRDAVVAAEAAGIRTRAARRLTETTMNTRFITSPSFPRQARGSMTKLAG